MGSHDLYTWLETPPFLCHEKANMEGEQSDPERSQ